MPAPDESTSLVWSNDSKGSLVTYEDRLLKPPNMNRHPRFNHCMSKRLLGPQYWRPSEIIDHEAEVNITQAKVIVPSGLANITAMLRATTRAIACQT
jgi:hypothetical protein